MSIKPTANQREFLRNLGFKDAGNISKSEASRKIDELLAIEEKTGARLKCPACKGRIDKRPKRSVTCPHCREKLHHINGKLHTTIQRDARRMKEAERDHKQWLRDRRSEIRDDVRDCIRDEKEYRRDFKEAMSDAFVIRISPGCAGAGHYNGALVPMQFALKNLASMPPYDGVCHEETCDCDVEFVSLRDFPRRTPVLQEKGNFAPKLPPAGTWGKLHARGRKTGCFSVVLLLLAVISATLLSQSLLIH